MTAPEEGLPTGFLLHSAAALHDPGWGHPEHQGRLRTLASTVGRDLLALHGRVVQWEAGHASMDALSAVHDPAMLERVHRTCREAGPSPREVGPETLVCEASWDAITGSSGALLEAVDGVLEGKIRNAFVATRPPGHHASAREVMGFCVVNHVAVAARHLLDSGRARRVAIVDWDVHHGNGTQDIFWDDPQVFYLSLHQTPLFPGTGAATEIGAGEGEGTTLNVPLPAGTGPTAYLDAFQDALARAHQVFRPDFILVSAGYDALAVDPLGGLCLEPATFHLLTRQVMVWAHEVCEGRMVAALEGGYDPRATGLAVAATLRALAGVPLDRETDPSGA
ncbi:MAG: histone deacetylase [Gemmatimonadales bacterium]|nr:MAG: histone deacetylase [Gemmatimonadales bacterium]